MVSKSLSSKDNFLNPDVLIYSETSKNLHVETPCSRFSRPSFVSCIFWSIPGKFPTRNLDPTPTKIRGTFGLESRFLSDISVFWVDFQPEVVACSILPVAGYDDHTPDWCSQHMSWQQWLELSRFLHVNCDIRAQQKSSPKRYELCLPSLGAPKPLGITYDFLYP